MAEDLQCPSSRPELRRLAAERDAVILAHNYQRSEVQDAADFVGDSLELSRKAAATTPRSVILFCGVHFMAETAHLLSPEKLVFMPDLRAGCPYGRHGHGLEGLKALKEQHPGGRGRGLRQHDGGCKGRADVCCTSSNAVEIVNRIPREQEIIFVPDKNLGAWVQRQTGRTMILRGRLLPRAHDHPTGRHRGATGRAPGSEGARPSRCLPEVSELADVVTSTSGMLRYPGEDPDQATTYVVATETGLLHRLEVTYPGKRFVAATLNAVCPNMKLTTLDKAIAALDEGLNEVTVPPRIRERAAQAVARMIA